MTPPHSTPASTRAAERAEGSLCAEAVAAPVDDEGLYLTDEVFLFRVLRVIDTDAGEVVELEDSYALDVVQVPINDPRLLGLRVVLPAPAHG